MTAPLTLPSRIAAVADVSLPAASRPAGYAALIAAHELRVPPPDEMVAIGEKHTLRREGRWHILTRSETRGIAPAFRSDVPCQAPTAPRPCLSTNSRGKLFDAMIVQR
jgi:hypothetical protein